MIKPRPMGTETEYGILRPGDPYASAIAISAQVVRAYLHQSRPALPGLPAVRWDYGSEDPLNDMRGHRLQRAAAHPSQLTDDEDQAAPSGLDTSQVRRPDEDEFSPAVTNMVLSNGARYYVDHAHPEYSSPETGDAMAAVLYDRAGDEIAIRSMQALPPAEELVLYKNNVDGKGAAYGSHENYLIKRQTIFSELAHYLIPFFVSRPIICGSGRVGIGQRSQVAGFQISQRADYIENDIGLETTFNRPIVNTRDEPHANSDKYRRLHVIGGDANQFDISILLRLGTTSLVLDAIESGVAGPLKSLEVVDPVSAAQVFSHDTSLQAKVACSDGTELSALDIQKRWCELITDNQATLSLTAVDQQVLATWQKVLTLLETDIFSAGAQVEWVAKYQLFESMRQRLGGGWDHPKLVAMDYQWADLRPEKSLVSKLDKAGMIERLFTMGQVKSAADQPPADTRAAWRGMATGYVPAVVAAGWDSIVVDTGDSSSLTRVTLSEVMPGPSQEQIKRLMQGDATVLMGG